jgi:drug/metabolite transporter (DMT)-like permease
MSQAMPQNSAARADLVYRLVGIAMAVAGTLCFSVRPVLIKAAYADMRDPVTLIALRMAVAWPFFIAMALWAARRAVAPLSRLDLAKTAALGFLGYYVASFADFVGLQYVTAGLGRLLLFLYPTVVVLLGATLFGKKVTARDAVALLLTYLGVACVMASAIGELGNGVWLGAGLIFASAVAYAVYLVGGGEIIRRVGSFRFTAYAMNVACFFCLAQFLALRPMAALDLPVRVYWLSLAIGTACTVIPIFLTAEGLRRIGAKQVAIVGGLGPVSSYGIGMAFLGEPFSTAQLVGGLLVVAGVLLVTLKPGG